MRRKAFDPRKEVKAIARERVGSPKPSRAIEPKTKRKKAKHKKLEAIDEESPES
jgi:hypothetical protein